MNSQTPSTVAGLSNLNDFAPIAVQQALLFSSDLSSAYLQDHVEQSTAPTPVEAASLAMARLQWILQSTRRELNGLFDEAEIQLLIDCFHGELFFPDLLNNLASNLCDHLGIDLDSVEESEVASLVRKLLGLTPSQRATLADALEQTWHRGLKTDQSAKEFFGTLGIIIT